MRPLPVRVNEEVLASIGKVAGVLAGKIDAVAPSIDGLLASRASSRLSNLKAMKKKTRQRRLRPKRGSNRRSPNLVEMRRARA